jgi:hypothetical protein
MRAAKAVWQLGTRRVLYSERRHMPPMLPHVMGGRIEPGRRTGFGASPRLYHCPNITHFRDFHHRRDVGA